MLHLLPTRRCVTLHFYTVLTDIWQTIDVHTMKCHNYLCICSLAWWHPTAVISNMGGGKKHHRMSKANKPQKITQHPFNLCCDLQILSSCHRRWVSCKWSPGSCGQSQGPVWSRWRLPSWNRLWSPLGWRGPLCTTIAHMERHLIEELKSYSIYRK